MKIEEELFQKHSADEKKLAAYGFRPAGSILVFTKDLPEENFRIVVEYNGSFSGKIIDLSAEEEYVNFRREDASGFSAEIKSKFVGLLTDIRERCCVNQYYECNQTKRIIAHIHEVYGDEPEFLWKAYPTFAAIRKKSNKKWYALFGGVPRNKVDKNATSEQMAEVVNVKVGDVNALLKKNGYYPAYHMNKKNWVSVILDDTIADAEIHQLIADSFNSV